MQRTLFSGMSLAKHLAGELLSVRQSIAQVTSEAQLDDADRLRSWEELGEVAPLEVHRDEAAVAVIEDEAVGRAAKLSIPYAGGDFLFQLQADTFRDDLVGDVERQMWDTPKGQSPQVHFTERLTGDVTASAIKDWAKKKADSLEEHVAWSNEQINRHNQQLFSAISTMIASRRKELQQIAKLNEDLSGGI